MRHPDTIRDLAPDCRRVLREAFAAIQAAENEAIGLSGYDNTPIWDPGTGLCVGHVGQTRTDSTEKRSHIAAAIVHYREVSALWGVEV